MSNLLINESPLQVLPSLAVEVGLNEAIILQQIHYWTQPRGQWEPQEHDGHRWVYNSYAEWVHQFPFWSERTVRRALSSLERQGLAVTAQPRKQDGDATKWYRIDYGALQRIDTDSTPSGQDGHTPSGQNDHPPVDKVTTPSGQDGQSREYSKERARDRDYTETTPETTSSKSVADADFSFVPKDHQYLVDDMKSHYLDIGGRPGALTHLANRLLTTRNNNSWPKKLVASQIRSYDVEKIIAAWTIASTAAQNNPAKYANSILEGGFKSPKRKESERKARGPSRNSGFTMKIKQ